MRRPLIIVLVLTLCMQIVPAGADEKTWDDLQERAIELFQRKDYTGAIATQRRALEEAKETFGPDHMNVAESLDNLAIYTSASGDNVTAEKLYRQALAILEGALPPDDQYLAIFMNYLAGFFRRIGKPGEARRLQERAREIRKGRIQKSDAAI